LGTVPRPSARRVKTKVGGGGGQGVSWGEHSEDLWGGGGERAAPGLTLSCEREQISYNYMHVGKKRSPKEEGSRKRAVTNRTGGAGGGGWASLRQKKKKLEVGTGKRIEQLGRRTAGGNKEHQRGEGEELRRKTGPGLVADRMQ